MSQKHRSPTYTTWCRMRHRCNNQRCEQYPRYGGRGIKVCDRWESYEQFVLDMGVKPEGKTLDRIDNDGDYTPENCRWATSKEQAMNRPLPPHTKFYTVGGVTKTLREWAAQQGKTPRQLRQRAREIGKTIQWCIENPPRKPRPKKLPVRKKYTVNGVTDSIANHARRAGLPPNRVYVRMSRGASLADALAKNFP